MVLEELVGYIAIVVAVILINAEIKFRKKIKYFKNLGYRHPREKVSRTYCIVTSFVQIALLVAISMLVWGLITNWNDPICINN